MAKKEYIKSEVTRAARPRSERLRSLGLQTSGGGGTTSAGGLASMYLETLRSRIDTHAKDTTVHVTADEKSLWNSLASLFELVDIGTEESPLMAIKAKYGLFSNSFISARGSDPEAGSGGSGGGLDVQEMWYALAQPTTEKINVSHIPAIGMDKVSGLTDALAGKLSGITGEMVKDALGYTPYDASQIGSASVKYAASAGKVAHALTIYNDGGSSSASAKTYNGSAAVTINIPTTLPASDVYSWAKQPVKPSYTFSEIGSKPSTLSGYGITDGVNAAEAAGHLTASVSGHTLSIGVASGYTIPTASQITLWDKICALFDVDTEGNVYVTGSKGFWSNSFISARGSDPGAGSGGGSGVDMESVWYAMAQPTTEKINASHIPLLQQLSGALTNAQLANSAITVAGVRVSLGGAVTTAQIASALTGSGYKLTDNDTTYTLTKSGSTITLTGSDGRKTSVTDSNTTYTLGSFGITATAAEINKLDGLATTAAELGYVHGVTSPIQTQLNAKANASALAAYALKDGSNASGWWPINVTGAAERSNVLSGTTDTAISNYVRYRQVSGSPSLVGSTAGGGAWGLPSTGPDAEYANGQILRLGWSPEYYTDIFTGPNDFGSAAGIQFRQVVAGKMSSRGWRTLLDTANYAGTLDTRYLLKSAYTASDILAKLKTVDGSGSGLDADLLDGTQKSGLLTSVASTAATNLSVTVGGTVKSVADLYATYLDGHPATSFDLSTNLGACQDYGVYVIGLMQITDYTAAGNMANGTLIFIRQNGNNPAQKIIYSLSTRYGSNNVRFGYLTLSTNIWVQPCTFTYNGKKWAGFQVSSASSYSSGVICVRDGLRLGERSSPFLLKYGESNTGAVINSEVNSSVVINGADIIESGVHSNAFSGNASSATKLATARLLWGRSFDGSGDIRGNIIVGDAIIHGSVTSNNTRFISSDNASNIYFSVGGLVNLVAEPSCLRRGASNTSETLGTSTYRWANVYAVNGDYSGNMTVSGWINGGLNISIFGSNSDNSDTTRFLAYGHNVEFGGPGYAHVDYYLRPRYGSPGSTRASLYIQNASAAASPVFSTTHAFYNNGNAYHYGNLGLGTAAPSYKLDVRGSGYFSGVLTASGGLTTPQYVQVGDARLKWDASNNALYVEKSDGTACGLYSKGYISARGSDPESATGGSSELVPVVTLSKLTEGTNVSISVLANAGLTNDVLEKMRDGAVGRVKAVYSDGSTEILPVLHASEDFISFGYDTVAGGYQDTMDIYEITIPSKTSVIRVEHFER